MALFITEQSSLHNLFQCAISLLWKISLQVALYMHQSPTCKLKKHFIGKIEAMYPRPNEVALFADRFTCIIFYSIFPLISISPNQINLLDNNKIKRGNLPKRNITTSEYQTANPISMRPEGCHRNYKRKDTDNSFKLD